MNRRSFLKVAGLGLSTLLYPISFVKAKTTDFLGITDPDLAWNIGRHNLAQARVMVDYVYVKFDYEEYAFKYYSGRGPLEITDVKIGEIPIEDYIKSLDQSPFVKLSDK